MDVRSDTVDLMSYIKWCDALKSGCDVVYTVVVMTQIMAVMSHVKCIHCPHTGCGFIYRGCDVISTVV